MIQFHQTKLCSQLCRPQETKCILLTDLAIYYSLWNDSWQLRTNVLVMYTLYILVAAERRLSLDWLQHLE